MGDNFGIVTTLCSFGFTPIVSGLRLYIRLLDDSTKAYDAVHIVDFDIASSSTALKEETVTAIKEVYRA